MSEKITHVLEKINANNPLAQAEKLAKTKPEVKEFVGLWKKIDKANKVSKKSEGFTCSSDGSLKIIQ
jgi:hypothetical protein